MASMMFATKSQGVGDQYYQPGDCICAYDDDRIKCVHAEHACHPKIMARNSNGTLVTGCLTEDFFMNTAQYKLQRISKTKIKRIKLSDMGEEILGAVPNAKGEYMDVPLFIYRRMRRHLNSIFGAKGSEYWYGGKRTVNSTILSTIWAKIESKTSLLESDHVLWPHSLKEQKTRLLLPVDAMTTAERHTYEAREYNITDPDNPILVKKRKHKTTMGTLARISAESIAKINNPNIPMDFRKFSSWTRSTIMQVKP